MYNQAQREEHLARLERELEAETERADRERQVPDHSRYESGYG